MKTTKTFRLLAVLLALVLGLGTICTALAEQSVPLDALTEDQYTEWLKQVEAINIVPETVVFTKAGPFMPPVNVAVARRAAILASENGETSDKGIKLKKDVALNEDGTYKITLEAYTTGTVTTVTKTTPVDIVLVLDQSGSMKYGFDGEQDVANDKTRQYAMKQAVNSFIDEVHGKYSNEADHRMAIVTFSDNAKTLQDWTAVDDNGKTTLKGQINNLTNSPSGGTQTQKGMNSAQRLMTSGSGYSYTGNNTERQKVVVLFTDGAPGDYAFNISIANRAILTAKSLKDDGITVFTVGIFNGADPKELYGTASSLRDKSDGTIDSYWTGQSASYIILGEDEQQYKRSADAEAAASNRFMNLLSSNFKGADSLGLSYYSYKKNRNRYYGYKIDKNYDRSASNYYLTASDSDSLDTIFKSISNQIETPTIELGTETTIKDIITDSFELSANADVNSIEIYTADATANALKNPDAEGAWKEEVRSSLTASISADKRTISVNGFNYDENFVTDTPRGDNNDFYGRKLIIKFDVKVRNSFLGGNDVKTNGTDSGIYDKDGNLVDEFVVPTVNVPIKDVTVAAQDKNVYLLGEVTAEQLKNGATVNVGDVELKLGESNYGLADWQTAYVDITVEVTDADGNALSEDALKNLSGDKSYKVKVTVSPKTATPSAGSSGAAATAKENSATANINVFKPELTFKDSTVEFKKSVLTLNSQNYADIKAYFEANNKVSAPIWKHGNTESTVVTMIGTEPTLDLTYTPEDGKIVDNIVESTTDIPVKVEVKIGTADVTSNTTFVHQECNLVDNCQWTAPTEKGNPAFLLHVINVVGDLTITKNGLNEKTYTGENEDRESAIFKVEGDNQTWYVAINANANGTGSVTLTGLEVGSYTVTELTDWTWRYGSSTLTSDDQNTDGTFKVNGGQTTTVICTNSNHNDKWLGGDNYANNVFAGSNTPATD